MLALHFVIRVFKQNMHEIHHKHPHTATLLSVYLEHGDVQLAPLQAGFGSLQVGIQPPQQVHFLPGCVVGGGQDRGSVQQQLGDTARCQTLLHCLLTKVIQRHLQTQQRQLFSVLIKYALICSEY